MAVDKTSLWKCCWVPGALSCSARQDRAVRSPEACTPAREADGEMLRSSTSVPVPAFLRGIPSLETFQPNGTGAWVGIVCRRSVLLKPIPPPLRSRLAYRGVLGDTIDGAYDKARDKAPVGLQVHRPHSGATMAGGCAIRLMCYGLTPPRLHAILRAIGRRTAGRDVQTHAATTLQCRSGT